MPPPIVAATGEQTCPDSAYTPTDPDENKEGSVRPDSDPDCDQQGLAGLGQGLTGTVQEKQVLDEPGLNESDLDAGSRAASGLIWPTSILVFAAGAVLGAVATKGVIARRRVAARAGVGRGLSHAGESQRDTGARATTPSTPGPEPVSLEETSASDSRDLELVDALVELVRSVSDTDHGRVAAVLEKAGLTRLAPSPGTQFDPHLHRIVGTVEKSSQESGPGVIVETIREGWQSDAEVVVPAEVVVRSS